MARIAEFIPDSSDSIPDVGRTEERDDEIGTRPGAPFAERLAEVALVLVEPGRGGRIEQPAQTQRRVEDEPASIVGERLELRLEEIVYHDDRISQVVEEIGDAGLHEVRRDLAVRARDGFQDGAVEL